MNELALFAGAGGGILGGKLLGWRTVCAVEWDAYAASVLMARQNDGSLPPFPIWDDVQTFDGRPWRGRVDVVSGGFPCQDISVAGKGAGIEGVRSGMWVQMARIIREVFPRFVFVENSPMLASRGLGTVLGDLATMGYHARWGVLGAIHAGAPHRRDRIWIVASLSIPNTNLQSRSPQSWKQQQRTPQPQGGSSERLESWANVADAHGLRELQSERIEREERRWFGDSSQNVAYADLSGRKEQWRSVAEGAKYQAAECGGWWSVEPNLGRVAHGVANRVDRLKAIGNGQVPAVAALAWRILSIK